MRTSQIRQFCLNLLRKRFGKKFCIEDAEDAIQTVLIRGIERKIENEIKYYSTAVCNEYLTQYQRNKRFTEFPMNFEYEDARFNPSRLTDEICYLDFLQKVMEKVELPVDTSATNVGQIQDNPGLGLKRKPPLNVPLRLKVMKMTRTNPMGNYRVCLTFSSKNQQIHSRFYSSSIEQAVLDCIQLKYGDKLFERQLVSKKFVDGIYEIETSEYTYKIDIKIQNFKIDANLRTLRRYRKPLESLNP
jgi:hypothetical protein